MIAPNPRVSALIPARGGSKGLPRKNLVPFLGEPLVVHSVRAALEARSVTDVVVSTDDDEIAEVARGHGASVLRRPGELASDTATTESAIDHFLRSGEGPAPDLIVLLQPTSPLRPAGAIDEAVAKLVEGGFDTLLSLAPTHRFYWTVEGERAEPRYDFMIRPRRQDLGLDEIAYVETGSIYVFTREHFERSGNRLGGRIGHVIHSEPYALEIDTPADLAALEALARSLDRP
ncbi:MAG: acylneuraminate cytidylyltransferase [Gemmatimonadetes bacterium]|nr:acylneuraminate cytidylyltransferase [Gemmatimonadota bacterium]